MSRTGAGQAVRCQLGHMNPSGTRVCNLCSGPIGVMSAYCTRGHYIGTGSTVCANCGSGPSTLHTYGGGAPSSSQPTESAVGDAKGEAVRCQLGHLNPAGTRVCHECNGPIVISGGLCPNGHYNSPGQRLCGQCGETGSFVVGTAQTPIGAVQAYCPKGHFIPTEATVCAQCGRGPGTFAYGYGVPSSSEPTEPTPPARPTPPAPPVGGASWQRQPATVSKPAPTSSADAGKKNKSLLIILGAVAFIGLLVIGAKAIGGGSGSSDSLNGSSGSQYPTYDTPTPAPIPPSTDDDWKAAVCRPGYYSDRSAILPNADWSASCQSMRGNPIIMGWYTGSFSVQNDLALFHGATFAQLPTSDGRTAIFLTPVRGTGGALEPLTQFGFTLGAVP